jgi:hypothetical protein
MHTNLAHKKFGVSYYNLKQREDMILLIWRHDQMLLYDHITRFGRNIPATLIEEMILVSLSHDQIKVDDQASRLRWNIPSWWSPSSSTSRVKKPQLYNISNPKKRIRPYQAKLNRSAHIWTCRYSNEIWYKQKRWTYTCKTECNHLNQPKKDTKLMCMQRLRTEISLH